MVTVRHRSVAGLAATAGRRHARLTLAFLGDHFATLVVDSPDDPGAPQDARALQHAARRLCAACDIQEPAWARMRL